MNGTTDISTLWQGNQWEATGRYMPVVTYNGENYHCCLPERIAGGKYTCAAWNQRTHRPVKGAIVLDALGEILLLGCIRG